MSKRQAPGEQLSPVAVPSMGGGLQTKLDKFMTRLSEVSSRLGNDNQRDWLIGKLEDRLSELEDIAFVVEVPVGDSHCPSQSTRKRAKLDPVETAISRFESPMLRRAVSDRCSDSPNFLTTLVSECIWEHLDNIARGESLRLLPLETLTRIFSYIDIEERVRVLETISGGQNSGQRIQVNFRRAVLESYKTVESVEDLGEDCSKLKLLQITDGDCEELQSRFPNLSIKFDGCDLQGFLTNFHFKGEKTIEILHLNSVRELADGEISLVAGDSEEIEGLIVVPTEFASLMIIGGESRNVHVINLIDVTVEKCGSMQDQHMGGAAIFFNDSVIVVGGETESEHEGNRCERYNPATNSWERIANLNHERHGFQLITWNDSLYAVGGTGSGGTMERYDPSTNTWTVVLKESYFDNQIHAAVTVDDTLYYGAPERIIGENDLPWDPKYTIVFWKVNIRERTKPEKLDCGLSMSELSFSGNMFSLLYGREGCIRLLFYGESIGQEDEIGLSWDLFDLDRSESMWRKVDTNNNIACIRNPSWFHPLFL